MSEEINRPEEAKTEIINTEEIRAEEAKVEEIKAEEIKTEEVKPEEVKTEPIKKSAPENDLSNVKIRHVLVQRIKKYGARKIISYLLVAIIFFCGGLLADRLVMRHGVGRGFYGRPGIQRNMPGNFFENKQMGGFGRQKGQQQQPPANNNQSPNQTQGTQPPTGQ